MKLGRNIKVTFPDIGPSQVGLWRGVTRMSQISMETRLQPKKPFKFNKQRIFSEKLHNYTLSLYFDSFKNFSRLEKLSCDCLQQFQVTCLGTCAIITHSDLCYKTACYWPIIKRNIYFLSKNSIVLITTVVSSLFITVGYTLN